MGGQLWRAHLGSPSRARQHEVACARLSRTGTLVPVYTIHGTKKLLDRVKQPVMPVVEHPTTALGKWYATATFWRPQASFLVNESTLFPVLLPLAPATSVAARFPEALGSILKVLGVNTAFIATERWAMSEARLSKTANRSMLGIMNRLEMELDRVRDHVGEDLVDLSLYMSDHLVGPLGGSESRTPQDKLMEIVQSRAWPGSLAHGTEVSNCSHSCLGDRTREVPSELGERCNCDNEWTFGDGSRSLPTGSKQCLDRVS